MWWRRCARSPLPGMRMSPASLCVVVLLLLSLAAAGVLLQAGVCVGGTWAGCVAGRGMGGGRVFGWGRRPVPHGSPHVAVAALVQLRRDVANTLLRLAADLRTGRSEGVADQLEATASLLDSRNYHPGHPLRPPTLTRPAHIPPLLSSPARHVHNTTDEHEDAKDKYSGPGKRPKDWLPGRGDLVGLDAGSPLSLATEVTVLVDGCATPPNYLVGVVRQAVGTWPGVGVVVGVAEADRAEVEDVSGLPHVELLTVACGVGGRGALPDLTQAASTSFALVLSGVSAITGDLDLPRLLSVAVGLGSLGVGVVGGSERGRDGAVDYTCTSLTVRNHVIEAKEGYTFSAAACVYCDVTSGSFLASVSVLRDTPLDHVLPLPAQAMDWALRLQRAGVLSLTCPDVMFHVIKEVRGKAVGIGRHQAPDRVCSTPEERKAARGAAWQARRQYRKLAQKWEVSSVVLTNGTRLEYTCREVGIECAPQRRTRHYTLPPCCLALKGRMLAALDIVSQEARIPYNIAAGTLLGALKFHGPLPWDFDDDAHTAAGDVASFTRHTIRLRRLGLSPHLLQRQQEPKKKHNNNSTRVHGSNSGNNNNSSKNNNKNKANNMTYIWGSGPGGFGLDLWPRRTLVTKATPQVMATIPDNLPCLMHAHDPTPIREVRNHPLNASACHLASLVRVGGLWAPGPWNPGHAVLYKYGDGLYRHEAHWRWRHGEAWPACPRPGHHACLDLHPMDGSLPFL